MRTSLENAKHSNDSAGPVCELLIPAAIDMISQNAPVTLMSYSYNCADWVSVTSQGTIHPRTPPHRSRSHKLQTSVDCDMEPARRPAVRSLAHAYSYRSITLAHSPAASVPDLYLNQPSPTPPHCAIRRHNAKPTGAWRLTTSPAS